MNKYLVVRIALGAGILGGIGFGLYKLYDTKKSNKTIDISDKVREEKEKAKAEPESEAEAEVEVEVEVVEADETFTVEESDDVEPTVTVEEVEEEEHDEGYDTYDDHGWS